MKGRESLDTLGLMARDRSACPFCAKSGADSNRSAKAFADIYPISKGHFLVVPKRHVGSLFELSDAERAAVWALAGKVRATLNKKYRPSGFNIGLNDGAAAGQTIGHAHVHVIPRYARDAKDPRGGVRWVLPKKAKYWKT